MPPKDADRRTNILLLFFMLAVALIIFRLGYVQLVHGEEYRDRSDNNRFRQLTSLAPRGAIYDSRGIELAGNRPGYFVAIYDTRSKAQAEVLARLVHILDPEGENQDISVEEFQRRIRQNRYRRWQPVRLIDRPLEFGDERLIQIEEMRVDLPDIIVQVQPVRSYPQGQLAAHLLGGMRRYTGSWEDLRALWESGLTGYRIDSMVGELGLEAAFEFVDTGTSLKGVDGWQWIEVDHLSRPVRELEAVPSVPGNNVHLTIDAEFQGRIEQWLVEEYVPNILSNLNTETREIGAVALDPRTGKVLLSISYPSFDPAEIVTNYAALLSDKNRPLENKVVSAYAPGSVFKPVTMVAALSQGADINAIHYCGGRLHHPSLGSAGKVCWVLGYPSLGRSHGNLGIIGALQNSCNIYFYQLGLKMFSDLRAANVLDVIANAAEVMGLGAPTLIPELRNFRQDSGVLPTSEKFRQLQREYVARNPADNRTLNPYPAEVLDITIGQGIQTYSPLQIANYMSILATGHRYAPYIVDKITTPTGEVVMQTEPVLEASLVRTEDNPLGLVNAAELAQLQEGLRRVTQVPGGTGVAAFRGAPYFTSGKTGTAEVFGKPSHGWFAVWGAETANDEPEIVVSVFVKHGTGGSAAAGPIARAIMDEYFRLKTERDTQ